MSTIGYGEQGEAPDVITLVSDEQLAELRKRVEELERRTQL